MRSDKDGTFIVIIMLKILHKLALLLMALISLELRHVEVGIPAWYIRFWKMNEQKEWLDIQNN